MPRLRATSNLSILTTRMASSSQPCPKPFNTLDSPLQCPDNQCRIPGKQCLPRWPQKLLLGIGAGCKQTWSVLLGHPDIRVGTQTWFSSCPFPWQWTGQHALQPGPAANICPKPATVNNANVNNRSRNGVKIIQRSSPNQSRALSGTY